MKKANWRVLVFLLVGALFVFLRVWRIEQSLDLFGDLGRDLYELQRWATHPLKPPLLGPQTSAISFNQSAIYFYYLFPFFLMLGHSVYSTLIAAIFLYLAVFTFLFWWYREQPAWQWRLTALFFLLAIHPQFVMQQRLVWNPSLIAPFLMLSFWAWWEYQQSRQNKKPPLQPQWWLLAMMAALSLAVSLNFSILPTVAVFLFLFAWQERKRWQNIVLSLSFGAGAGLVFNLPTLVFELRHNFLLTKALPTQAVLQQDHSWWNKIIMLSANVIYPNFFTTSSVVLLVGMSLATLSIFIWGKKYFKLSKEQHQIFHLAFSVALGSALLLLLTPLKMHAHYMFGVLTFLIVALVALPRKILWSAIITAAILYLQPYYLILYQKPAAHSVVEKTSCLQTFCQTRKDQDLAHTPIFVNTHSASHNHQALEYVFLLREFGCQAIDSQQFNATPVAEMLVVADRSAFDHGRTAYYELSQFGLAQEVGFMECKPDLKLHYLVK